LRKNPLEARHSKLAIRNAHPGLTNSDVPRGETGMGVIEKRQQFPQRFACSCHDRPQVTIAIAEGPMLLRLALLLGFLGRPSGVDQKALELIR
jgi:hypothetical protein